LSLDLAEIQELSDRMERETKALKNELYRICWFMRGSLSVTESFNLSNEDLEVMNSIIKDNLETTKKSQMPFF
jgi:hypothetical protein